MVDSTPIFGRKDSLIRGIKALTISGVYESGRTVDYHLLLINHLVGE